MSKVSYEEFIKNPEGWREIPYPSFRKGDLISVPIDFYRSTDQRVSYLKVKEYRYYDKDLKTWVIAIEKPGTLFGIVSSIYFGWNSSQPFALVFERKLI